MKYVFSFLAFWILFAPTLFAQDADAIIEKLEEKMRGKTQHGTYEMQIVRPDWSRTIKMEVWGEGDEKSFIRILSPARDKGIGFLKIGREMWQYVPRVNRVVKIPPSMMLQSWMGSEFTNDDLVKESSQADDYTHQYAGSEVVNGKDCYKVRLLPKENAPVAWDRILIWVDKSNYLPVKETYYNERREPVRTISFSDVKTMSGREIPSRMEITEPNKPGYKTVMNILEATYDRPISSSIFTQNNLKRSR